MNEREQRTAADKARMDKAADTLWSSIVAICPGYELDTHNRPVLNELCYWMLNWPTAYTVQGAGIMLRGNVGTGKTDLMRALSRTMVRGNGEGFKVVSAVDLVSQFDRVSRDDQQNGGSKVIQKWGKLNEDLCIDDIGEEPEGKHFGQKRDVISEIITLRYALWKTSGYLTHFTTNILTNALFLERYDERISSRVFEMSRVVPLPGPDRRGSSAPVVQRKPELFAAEPAMPTEAEQEAAREKIEQVRAEHPHLFTKATNLRVEHPLRQQFGVPDGADVSVPEPDHEAHLATYTSMLSTMSLEDLEKDHDRISEAAGPGRLAFLEAIKREQISRQSTKQLA